jgi:hypothetical protein
MVTADGRARTRETGPGPGPGLSVRGLFAAYAAAVAVSVIGTFAPSHSCVST